MAALTATVIGKRVPIGDRHLNSFRFTIANANAADEWVAAGPGGTGLRGIDRIVGVTTTGTAATTDMPVFKRNCATGTGGTEDTASAGGALSIEGAAGTYEVTLIGKI